MTDVREHLEQIYHAVFAANRSLKLTAKMRIADQSRGNLYMYECIDTRSLLRWLQEYRKEESRLNARIRRLVEDFGERWVEDDGMRQCVAETRLTIDTMINNIKATLASREHLPSKAERKAIRQAKARNRR